MSRRWRTTPATPGSGGEQPAAEAARSPSADPGSPAAAWIDVPHRGSETAPLGTDSPGGPEVSGFRQNEPGDEVPVSEPSSTSLSYDQDDLYVIFICEDDPRPDRGEDGPERDDRG